MRIERAEWDGKEAPAFAGRLRALAPADDAVTADVARIVESVRTGGDAGLREVAERLDEAVPESFRVDPEAVAAAPGLLEPEVRDAMRVAANNIEAVARAELEVRMRPATSDLPEGQRVEVRDEPIATAGVYAPGGRAAYPSSVLMCCIPARVAGVARICVASPPGAAGRPNAGVLAACVLAGVDEVYAMGGAQAIAALAFGTETIDPVDLIAGPGNRYVTEAKRSVWGKVGIDGFAGPTELMVVADGMANPEWIALDLCAQGEHGDDSPLIVASADLALLDRIAELVSELVPDRPSVADTTLVLVYTRGLEQALTLADAVAPEHLELAFEGADETVARARVAGCVFVGAGGAAAFGDYAAGSNHVLPTGGAARFGGPLGPGTFRRRTSVVTLPSASASALAGHVAALARVEGFPVHGESAQARARG
ncbi:MAG TPA: histidinol dehydrogenase [Solirubrobacterales bacterium]|nr:histidinol dehydrogenase [Solirubrobacterales bacterium]